MELPRPVQQTSLAHPDDGDSSVAHVFIKEQDVRTGHDFSGLWIPLVTPFKDGQVDHAALTLLVRRLANAGVAGLVPCGSTGEAAALDDNEQLAVLDTTLSVAGKLPVVMGLSGYHLGKTSRWITTLCQRPIAGLLLPPPHYIRPSQAGLLQWFTALADVSSVPVIVYDIPYRTGVDITRVTLLELAHHPRIKAVKDCGGDPAKTLALIAQGRLQVLAGEDLHMFSTLAQGGVGAIAASAHVATAEFVRLLALLRAGDLIGARAVWSQLVPWIERAFSEPNPAVTKAALALDGSMDGMLRAPMQPASATACSKLAALCPALGLTIGVSRR